IGDRVRFFCTVYDPASGGYRFDYSIFVSMFIGFMIIAIGVYFLIKEFVINKRK
nr:SCO family protein [Candidatus Thiopontia autotrophica]